MRLASFRFPVRASGVLFRSEWALRAAHLVVETPAIGYDPCNSEKHSEFLRFSQGPNRELGATSILGSRRSNCVTPRRPPDNSSRIEHLHHHQLALVEIEAVVRFPCRSNRAAPPERGPRSEEYPNLSAYVARGEARPAYKRAFAAQLAVVTAKRPTG